MRELISDEHTLKPKNPKEDILLRTSGRGNILIERKQSDEPKATESPLRVMKRKEIKLTFVLMLWAHAGGQEDDVCCGGTVHG